MAAIGAYTNPTWANGGTPAINATNLQAATTQIKNITDAAVSGGASPTKIWTSTNDGNSGIAPAPKSTLYYESKELNAYTTITLENTNAIYLVSAWNSSQGGGAVSIIATAGGAAYSVASLATHANVSIVLSGLDIRATNLHASTSNIMSSANRVGW